MVNRASSRMRPFRHPTDRQSNVLRVGHVAIIGKDSEVKIAVLVDVIYGYGPRRGTGGER